MQDLAVDDASDPGLDADLYRLRRGAQDLYARSSRGMLYHALASIVFLISLGPVTALPMLAWLAPAAFILLGILRFLHRVPAEGAKVADYRHWRMRHWLLIDAASLLWSGHLVTAGMMGTPYSLTLVLALACSIAFGTALCYAFAMDLKSAFGALCCLCLPGLIAFTLVIPDTAPLAFMLGSYFLYLIVTLRRSHTDYIRQIGNEHALLLSRAETERLVGIDSLTGLANRRDYERRFERAWFMAARSRGDLALLVIDLDNFKQLNDTWGHAAGDACLRHFAQTLSQHFRRAGDFSARIGGEEFAVILTGATSADAARLGEEFRQALSGTTCLYRDQHIPISASIGAGAANWETDSDPVATFARIDQACYEAKKQGRSRLVAT